ncbi:hypothetical protein ACFRKE_16775, partial [Kitasatospora indigofera]
MQRAAATPALISDPTAFEGRLATRRNPMFHGRLGHLVSPQAPAGVLHGLLRPVPGQAVQRSTDGTLPLVRPEEPGGAAADDAGYGPGSGPGDSPGEGPAYGPAAASPVRRSGPPRPSAPSGTSEPAGRSGTSGTSGTSGPQAVPLSLP